MAPSSRLPSIPVVSAYGLLAGVTLLSARSLATRSSLRDVTPMALLTGSPRAASALAVCGVAVALLLAAAVIGLTLLTARLSCRHGAERY